MKKNYSYIILTLVLILIGLGFGVSLAYFLTQQQASGTITLGDLDFTVNFDFTKDMSAVPNQLIATNLTIKNEKENGDYNNLIDFYFRIQIEGVSENVLINLEPQFVNNNWFKDGNYYYYKNMVKPNEEVKVIDYILIDKETGNSVQNKPMEINVVFEAIQFNAVQDLWGEDIYKNLTNL